MDSFSIVVIAVQLLRHMGMLNDTVYHARPDQMRALVWAITAMNADGCGFDKCDIEVLCGEGEESDALSSFGQRIGFSSLNETLNEIFEQPDESGAGEEDGLCRAQTL